MTTIPLQGQHTVPTSATNVGAPSSSSQPARVDPTTKSHSEAYTSKGPQRVLDGADPPQSSGGLDTTTISQRAPQNAEPKKALVNVGTAASESQPAPPAPGVEAAEDPTTKSRSEAGTSKTPQRAPDSADPSQSSSGLAISQKETQTTGSEMTQTNTSDVGTPSLVKVSDSLKNQRTNGNIDVPAQSEDVKDGTLPSLSDAAQSNHSNEEVMNQNEKSSNPSQPGDGASTPSIKEKTDVNQLPQKEGLCSTEDANKQKASDPAQAEDGQEEDVNQPRLEAKIRALENIVDQQKREYKEEIECFKARISTVEAWLFSIWLFSMRLFSMWLFSMELFSMEHGASTEHKREIERLEGKHEKEIQRMEAVVERLQTKVSSKEHVTNTEHKQEIERLEGKHNEETQRLGAIVADMREKVLMLEKEIEHLDPKVSSEVDAKQPKTGHARDRTKSPEEKPIDSSQPPQAQAAKHSSIAANQINGLKQESGIVKEQNKSLPSTSASGEQTNTHPPQAVAPKADSLSVTDVANLVKALNAEIGQAVLLLMESLSDVEPSASDNESEIAFDELRNYLGPWLCGKLQEKSEPDPLIAQLALQTGLANACSSVVNDSPFWYNGSILQTLYRKMAGKEGQLAADEWKAKASNYLDLPQCEDANKKYLKEVLLKVATAAVGGTLKSSESLLSQYNQQVEVIANLAAKLHKTITEEVTTSELITYTVSCDTEFDASRMEDTENNHGSTPHGKVICTQDMGLLWRKRVEPKKPRGSLKDWGVTMKAKVVLAATLEGGKDRKRK